jgi:hypothetical protein
MPLILPRPAPAYQHRRNPAQRPPAQCLGVGWLPTSSLRDNAAQSGGWQGQGGMLASGTPGEHGRPRTLQEALCPSFQVGQVLWPTWHPWHTCPAGETPSRRPIQHAPPAPRHLGERGLVGGFQGHLAGKGTCPGATGRQRHRSALPPPSPHGRYRMRRPARRDPRHGPARAESMSDRRTAALPSCVPPGANLSPSPGTTSHPAGVDSTLFTRRSGCGAGRRGHGAGGAGAVRLDAR